MLPAARHQWALSLFRQPTYYTALSFNQAWALPTAVVPGRPVTVSFSVGNHQGRAIRYRYVLTEQWGGNSQVLAESASMVGAGATWTVSTPIRPSCASSPCRIEVALPGHPEIIDFIVTLKAG